MKIWRYLTRKTKGLPPMDKENEASVAESELAFKSDIAAVNTALDEMGARLVELGRRLTTLEQFLPILGEHFAGRLGGTSEDGAAVFDALHNTDPDALRDALERFASEAKSTEIPVVGGDAMESNVAEEKYIPPYMRG